MTTKTTYILTLLFLTFGVFACGQNKTDDKDVKTDSKFSLTISTYNHDEQISKGTLTYKLTDNILIISRRTMFSEKDTILLSKIVDEISREQIENIHLDRLEDFYFNNCVMATSGNEYYVSTNVYTLTKTIHLHHYYDKQIDMLINELNKQIPDRLKIDYLANNTKQDCK